MKKKLTILLLAVIASFAFAFCLAACGDSTDKTDNSGNGGNSGNTEQDGNNSNNGGDIAVLNDYEYTVKDGKYEITKVKDARITEAVIPDSVTSIAMDAFRGCTELKKLVIPDSVTYIGFEAFAGCDNIEEVSCPASAISNLPTKTKLKTVVITSGDSIVNEAFSGCKSLTSVSIPDSVTSVGNRAFSGCSSLTSITIPDSVTSIGEYAFSGCTSLTSVTIPDSVTNIGNSAFSGCSGLISITIPNGVITIGESAFEWCWALTIYCEATEGQSGWESTWNGNCVVVLNCKNNEVAIDGYIYQIIGGIRFALKDAKATVVKQLSNIKTADIPANVTYKNITYSVTDIGDFAFSGCSALTSLTIPDSVTNIGEGAFGGCSSLTSVSLPDGVTFIGRDAFYGCSSLESITIPDGVTIIGAYAFDGCGSLKEIKFKDMASYCQIDGLRQLNKSKVYIGGQKLIEITSITIPEGVTSIGDYAFYGCSSLEKINYGGTKAQWNEIIKGTLWDDPSSNYTVYCTDGQITKS